MKIREKIRKVLTQNASPRSVAAGAAVGMFYGFLPFFGLKTLLSYFTSLLFKINTPAAIIAVTLHDLLLPFLPVVLRVEYQIGFWVLSHPHHFAPKIRRDRLNLDFFHHWSDFVRVGMPLLVGGIIVGIVAAAIVYGVLYTFLERRRRRRLPAAGQLAPGLSADRMESKNKSE